MCVCVCVLLLMIKYFYLTENFSNEAYMSK